MINAHSLCFIRKCECVFNVLILMATHFKFISGETTFGVEEWRYTVMEIQNCRINTFHRYWYTETVTGYRYEMLSMPRVLGTSVKQCDHIWTWNVKSADDNNPTKNTHVDRTKLEWHSFRLLQQSRCASRIILRYTTLFLQIPSDIIYRIKRIL